jgi:Transglycosylase SLT domain
MKLKMLVRVMLLSITTASGVSAGILEPLSGVGSDRSTLTLEQIEVRSERLQASTTFSLLRFPDALLAPGRIFSPAIWRTIERAAREYDLDPMLLAGMIFIESYGDPLAKSPTGPAGIAQLTRSSAKELGLATNKRIRVSAPGKKARYKTVDERYVPERAIMAMARRVRNRRAWLAGRIDFAVAEYHMGAGRMAALLSAYFGRTVKVSDVTSALRNVPVTYQELFWTNTPYFRPAVYEMLDQLNRVDYSPTYYFRVRQAMKLLEMYRQSPADYARTASVYQGRPNWQWTFVDQADPAAVPVRSFGEIQQEMGQRFVLLPDIASDFGVRAGAADHSLMAAERSTIGSALFIAHHLQRLQGDRYTGFEIDGMLTTEDEEEDALPVHGLGWAFDVPTGDLSKNEQRDLKFLLTDLRHAGLLAYVEEGSEPTFHVVRHPDHAARFEQFYWDVMAGSVSMSPPRLASNAAPVSDDDRRPSVLVAVASFFSRMYSLITSVG